MAAFARCRGIDGAEISDGFLDRVEDPRSLQQVKRARGRGLGLAEILVRRRPSTLRRHEAEIRQTEIGHGARRHPDVDRELRPYEHDDGAAASRLLRAVRPGTHHDSCTPRSSRLTVREPNGAVKAED